MSDLRPETLAFGLIAALTAAISWLNGHSLRYALIGGVANQYWGRVRYTRDIDIKVLVPELNYASLRSALRESFPERGRPAAPADPLIVDVQIEGEKVGFLLAIPGHDEMVVTRAVKAQLGELEVWLCTAEDLVIQKAVAGRGRDWQDIEGILIEQHGKLDRDYLEDWLSQYAALLERPEILAQYQDIQEHIGRAARKLKESSG